MTASAVSLTFFIWFPYINIGKNWPRPWILNNFGRGSPEGYFIFKSAQQFLQEDF